MEATVPTLPRLNEEFRELLALRGELVKRFLEVVADPSSHPERAELIAQVAQLDSVAYQVLWEMADARGLTPPDVIPPWQRD